MLSPALAVPSSMDKGRPGQTYICHFGIHGTVAIDTRYPVASITVDGIRHFARGGSYFYQTDDGKLAIAFDPEMTTWTYLSAEEPAGITDRHCKTKINRR